MMKFWFVCAAVAAMIFAHAAPVAADEIPDNVHQLTREYAVTGLAACDGYTFVLVGEKRGRRGDVELETRVLTDGEWFAAFRAHWSYSLTISLVAIKGELPSPLTAEALRNAEKLSLAVTDDFPGTGYVDDSNRAHKLRVTYRVALVAGDSDAAQPRLTLRRVRVVSYDQTGGVLADSDREGTDDGSEGGDSDGDGVPMPDGGVPAIPVPAALLLGLALLAACGLVVGWRFVGTRE